MNVKHALAWVRRESSAYGGDASFLALSGGSAGGHLAALTALTVGDEEFGGGNDEARDVEVDACIPFYGTHDMEGHPDLSGRFGRGLVTLLEEQVMKLTVLDNPEVFKKASPLRQVRADAPPFYVIQGALDTLIPGIVARRFFADFRKSGAPLVAYSEFPLAQHAFDTTASPRSAASTAGVLAFLDAVMAQKQAKAELSI